MGCFKDMRTNHKTCFLSMIALFALSIAGVAIISSGVCDFGWKEVGTFMGDFANQTETAPNVLWSGVIAVISTFSFVFSFILYFIFKTKLCGSRNYAKTELQDRMLEMEESVLHLYEELSGLRTEDNVGVSNVQAETYKVTNPKEAKKLSTKQLLKRMGQLDDDHHQLLEQLSLLDYRKQSDHEEKLNVGNNEPEAEVLVTEEDLLRERLFRRHADSSNSISSDGSGPIADHPPKKQTQSADSRRSNSVPNLDSKKDNILTTWLSDPNFKMPVKTVDDLTAIFKQERSMTDEEAKNAATYWFKNSTKNQQSRNDHGINVRRLAENSMETDKCCLYVLAPIILLSIPTVWILRRLLNTKCTTCRQQERDSFGFLPEDERTSLNACEMNV